MSIFDPYEAEREREEDAFGDGFTNEYQRASFVARLEHPPVNETPKARALTLAGKFVVLVSNPYYCRVTSAVTGEWVHVDQVFDTKAEADAYLAVKYLSDPDRDESSYYLFEVNPPVVELGLSDIIGDECPF